MYNVSDARYPDRPAAGAEEDLIEVWTTGERGLVMGEYSVWMSNVNPIKAGGATPLSGEVTTHINLSDAREEAAHRKHEFHWIRIYKGKIPKGDLIEYYQGGRLLNPDGSVKH